MPDMEWYYAIGKEQKGPVTEEQFNELVRTGVVTAGTLVWHQGMSAWQPYGQVSGTAPAPAAAPTSVEGGVAGPAMSATPSPAPAPYPPLQFNNPGAQQRDDALSKVKAPAIGLMIYGGLVGLFCLFALVGLVMGNEPPDVAGMDPEIAEIVKNVQGPSQFLSLGINVISVVVIFMGGLRMMSLKNHSLAVTASICCFLPCACPCCFLGIGVGIWALVVLNKPEVKGQFD